MLHHHPEIMRLLADEHIAALRRDAARPVRRSRIVPEAIDVELRLCRDADDPELDRLAELDGKPVPCGRLLLALVRGRIVAALPLAGGHVVADPFARTAELLPLLELRAAQLRPRRRLFLRHA